MRNFKSRAFQAVHVTLMTVASATCLMGSALTSTAAEARGLSYELDIPAQDLRSALQEVAAASHHKLLYMTGLVTGKTSTPVKGNFTAQEALQRVLSGTDLTFEITPESVVLIRDSSSLATDSSARNDRSENNVSSSGELLFAQAEPAPGDQSSKSEAATGASASDSTLEEIVVTAQKRQERLQDVPISISVLRGEELDSSTAEGISEALSRVPGVAITTTNFAGGGNQLAVRGVTAGSSQFSGSSPVAYYIDSVPFGLVKTASVPDSNAYDLERVEVLRGPQGTLYGATAQNGVVRILTKDADLNDFEFKARTAFSSTEKGGENYRADAALNLPLVPGKLAARAVAGYERPDGWIDRPNEKDANDALLRNFRLKINAQPTEKLALGLSAWSSRNEYGAPSSSRDDATSLSTDDESMETEYDAYGLKAGYDFRSFSLTSMTSYLEYASRGDVDLAALSPVLPNLFTGLDASIFSEELILNSAAGNAFKWSLGAFYRDGEDRLRQNHLGGGPPIDYSNLSESYAVFGEVGRRFFNNQLEWTLGLRYFHDDVNVIENISQSVPAQPLIEAPASFSATTPRAILTWYPSEDLTFYGSYSQGFRSGYHQDPSVAASHPNILPLEPDKLHNYEIGAKVDLLGGRISLETAAYYINWQDVQQTISLFSNGTNVGAGLNGESASGLGLDFGLMTRPIEGLELGLTFSWNDLAMDGEVRTFPFGAPPEGVALFVDGDRLNLSPEYTAGASAGYAFPLGGTGLTGRFSASANYVSEQATRAVFGPNQLVSTGDSILIARTSFAVDSRDRWTAMLFADNINNEYGTIVGSLFGIPDWESRLRPRTVGVQLEFRF